MVGVVSAALGSALPAIGGLLGLGVTLLNRKGSSPQPQPLPGATRDDAAAQQQANDELLRRKGGAADIITGVRGAEPAMTGLKTALGQ